MRINFYSNSPVFSKKKNCFRIKYNFFFKTINEIINNCRKFYCNSLIIITIIIIKNFNNFIKKEVTIKFYQKKINNYFKYNTISFVYFTIGIRLNSFIKTFCNKKNVFIKVLSYVTIKNRYLFQRFLNCFEQSILFMDNTYIFANIFFYKLFNMNILNTKKIYKIKRFFRFTVSSKRYRAHCNELIVANNINKISKFKLIK